MSKDILAFVVTGLGVLLCVSLVVMVLLGRRIDSDGDGPQELEFKGLRAKTNVIIMFLIVSLIPAVLPLYLVLDRPGLSADVSMYERWTVRGKLVAHNADDSTVLIQPEPTKVNINPDGSFRAEIPVLRGVDGKLNFPSLIIDNPSYRRETLDLSGLRLGRTFGARDYEAEFVPEEKAIVLNKPIDLLPRRGEKAPVAGEGGS